MTIHLKRFALFSSFTFHRLTAMTFNYFVAHDQREIWMRVDVRLVFHKKRPHLFEHPNFIAGAHLLFNFDHQRFDFVDYFCILQFFLLFSSIQRLKMGQCYYLFLFSIRFAAMASGTCAARAVFVKKNDLNWCIWRNINIDVIGKQGRIIEATQKQHKIQNKSANTWFKRA